MISKNRETAWGWLSKKKSERGLVFGAVWGERKDPSALVASIQLRGFALFWGFRWVDPNVAKGEDARDRRRPRVRL